MPSYNLTVNGQKRNVQASADMPLLWVLRDLLQLPGTKYGCGMGVCGACTVHQGAAAVRSCQVPISAAAGKSFSTLACSQCSRRGPRSIVDQGPLGQPGGFD